jgi:hypothetical protein
MNLLSPEELLPKLKTRRDNGNKDFIVTLRFDVALSGPMKAAKEHLEAQYGGADSYEIIEHGDPDKLGDLMQAGQVAVRAVYDINRAIAFMEARIHGTV